jgi:hypothetical protein
MVKLPNTDRLKEMSKGIIAESLVNKIEKLDLTSLTSFVELVSPLKGDKAMQDNDSLNLLLFGIMSLRPCFVDNKGFVRFANAYDGGEKDNDSFMLKPSIVIGIPQLPTILAMNNFFFNSFLKNKAVGGVRLEAKGRLTRRFTASRSVFKLK